MPEMAEKADVPFQPNALYYGDNLQVLRKYFPEDSVDLIYLDPPFNSKANYNVLFKGSFRSVVASADSSFYRFLALGRSF